MENHLQLKERSTDLIATVSNPEKLNKFERWLNVRAIIETALPISEMKRVLEPGEVEKSIDKVLTKLVGSLNLKWNLNDSQIKQVVEDLVDKYPNETVEDFILLFRKARQNEFGEIYRLDSAVIFGWMEYYLEEKYALWEKQLENEKQEYYKPPDKIAETDRLAAWKASIDAITVKSILPLTEKEVLTEGQEKPKKALQHPSASKAYVEQHAKHIRYIQANFETVGDKSVKRAGWLDEETWNSLNE